MEASRHDDVVQSFVREADDFIQKTAKYVNQGINPGGYYNAVWCRDASYILRDWFLSGAIDSVLQEITSIWSHQIEPNKEKIVYGRGSPEMRYLSHVADLEFEKTFDGALPTSIYHGHCEVFGKHPDIDSTALMISTTAWVLDAHLKNSPSVKTRKNSHAKLVDSLLPRMFRAVRYLQSRDVDGDGLLEQDHNEDWMDSVLRAGKIVYSQATWVLALTNLSLLLSHLGRQEEACKMQEMADNVIWAVEQHLWSGQDGCYMDKQEEHHLGHVYKTLTQDVSLYLVATTEKSVRDSLAKMLNAENRESETGFSSMTSVSEKTLEHRANDTLDAIKSRIWKDKWPLVTEAEMKATGPWILNPNVYHNHTFWPWATGIEILARSRYKRYEECAALLASLKGYDRNGDFLGFCEWVNPETDKRGGAFPFRTGISCIRIALLDISQEIKSINRHRFSAAA